MNQLRTCAALAALAVLLTGCATASAQPPATARSHATGHVAGLLLIEGGPIGPDGQQPGDRPISGTVTFTAAGHRQVAVTAGSSGRFSAWLPPGLYQVAGRSPDIDTLDGSGKAPELPCSQISATVTAGHATTIVLTCIVP